MTRQDLRRENEELRSTLGLRGHRMIEEWEALPPWLRDPLAAHAFIADIMRTWVFAQHLKTTIGMTRRYSIIGVTVRLQVKLRPGIGRIAH